MGNRVVGLYEINIPNAWSIIQANNIYVYCGNNPICFRDSNGHFIDILWDGASFIISIVDVAKNPSDPWAWAGLVGDAADLIPGVTGAGEAIKAAKVVKKTANVVDTAKDVTKAADKTKDVSKVVGNAVETWGKDASSKVLRENMISAGKNVPDYSNAAHHIVAGKAANAEGARQILEKFDIDINHSGNGVFLPTKKGVSDAAYHPSLHTDVYYQNVERRLKEATSRDEALSILNDIATELQEGTFPK